MVKGSYDFESYEEAVTHMSNEQLLIGVRFIRALLNLYGEYNNACGWRIDELNDMECCLQDEILIRFAGVVDGCSVKDVERKSA